MNPEYPEFIQRMLTLEPSYELGRILSGQPDQGLVGCLADHLHDTFQTSNSYPTRWGNALWLVELLTAEWVIRKVLNSTFRIPSRLLPPRKLTRIISKESEKNAKVIVAMWECLINLYGHGRVNQSPSNLLYVLLKENPLTGLFPPASFAKDTVTAGVFIRNQQQINAFLMDLSAVCSINADMVATRFVLTAMRDFADQSDIFRRECYRPFREARSSLITYYERCRPVVLHLDKAKPIRTHLR